MFRRKRIRFESIDPLGGGLSEEIAAARKANVGTHMLADISGEDLSEFWGSVIEDVRNDPNWFSFTQD